MSKLTGLHSIFREKSISEANIGFHTLTFASKMFKTQDDRSGGYRGTPDQSSVHGWDIKVLLFAWKPVTVQGQEWQCQNRGSGWGIMISE